MNNCLKKFLVQLPKVVKFFIKSLISVCEENNKVKKEKKYYYLQEINIKQHNRFFRIKRKKKRLKK